MGHVTHNGVPAFIDRYVLNRPNGGFEALSDCERAPHLTPWTKGVEAKKIAEFRQIVVEGVADTK